MPVSPLIDVKSQPIVAKGEEDGYALWISVCKNEGGNLRGKDENVLLLKVTSLALILWARRKTCLFFPLRLRHPFLHLPLPYPFLFLPSFPFPLPFLFPLVALSLRSLALSLCLICCLLSLMFVNRLWLKIVAKEQPKPRQIQPTYYCTLPVELKSQRMY